MFVDMTNGSSGITVKAVNLPAGESARCTMRNGAYYDVRVGTYGFYSYTKGYVQNGVLHESYTYSNYNVTYDPNTNLLTILRPSGAPAGIMYFIVVD